MINWREFNPDKMPREKMTLVVYSPADRYGDEVLTTDLWYYSKSFQEWRTANLNKSNITHYCPAEEFPFPGRKHGGN